MINVTIIVFDLIVRIIRLKSKVFTLGKLYPSPLKYFNFGSKVKQAGAELGQAQIKLELGFTSIKIKLF